MEETRKLKQEKQRIEKERRVFKDKLKMARKKIEELEANRWEGGDPQMSLQQQQQIISAMAVSNRKKIVDEFQ